MNKECPSTAQRDAAATGVHLRGGIQVTSTPVHLSWSCGKPPASFSSRTAMLSAYWNSDPSWMGSAGLRNPVCPENPTMSPSSAVTCTILSTSALVSAHLPWKASMNTEGGSFSGLLLSRVQGSNRQGHYSDRDCKDITGFRISPLR